MGVPEVPANSSTPSKCSKLHFIEPTFKLHTFTADIVDKKILFQVIKMVDSVMIFINLMDNMVLYDLSLGLFNTRRMEEPVTTKIIGNFVEDISKNMAFKFAKRLRKSVYISCNVENDKLMIPVIEKKLCEEIKSKPDKF